MIMVKHNTMQYMHTRTSDAYTHMHVHTYTHLHKKNYLTYLA